MIIMYDNYDNYNYTFVFVEYPIDLASSFLLKFLKRFSLGGWGAESLSRTRTWGLGSLIPSALPGRFSAGAVFALRSTFHFPCPHQGGDVRFDTRWRHTYAKTLPVHLPHETGFFSTNRSRFSSCS